jgi:hypothetical protein
MMDDIAREVLEVDVELAKAIRFSASTYTRDDIEPLVGFWNALISDIQKHDQTLILAGEIRPVLVKGPVKIGSQKMSLNSPLVAVIEDITPSGDEAGLYRCALVYQGGGRILAGPGDIAVTSEDSGAEVIVEAWNTFALQEKDFGPTTSFQLSQETVEAVKIYAAFQPQEDGVYPPLDLPEECWAFPIMTSDDPRLEFRETEVEVGAILGTRMFSLLDEIESRPVARPSYLRVASSQAWVPALNSHPRPKLRLV